MKKKSAEKTLSIMIDLCLSIWFTCLVCLEEQMFINIILILIAKVMFEWLKYTQH